MTQSGPSKSNTTGSVVEVPLTNLVQSPGFCVADYEPLANLLPPEPTSPEVSSPPRKSRRVSSMSRNIMKEAHFKGIRWARTSVSGPLDPEHKNLP